jgi:DNA-binding NtrC family response regulator
MNTFKHNWSSIELAHEDGKIQASSPATFFVSQRRHHVEITIPSGLVVSATESIRKAIAETLVSCGVVPIFATTIGRAVRHIVSSDPNFVVCQDEVLDGSYENILQCTIERSLPVIVVSRTGEWPEYFQAVDRGAHDFVGYPLIPGELQRIIGDFLVQPSGRRRAGTFWVNHKLRRTCSIKRR